jgi:phosphatidylglycerophosphatase C
MCVRHVAAFDWDRTLTVRDCVVPFLTRSAGRGRLVSGLIRRSGPTLAALATRDRDRVKALAARSAFRGRPWEQIADTGRRFANEVVGSWMRSDTIARMRWHQARGDAVVIVSASFDAYLRPAAEILDIDAVLCTELDVDAQGRCTGELREGNCRGPRKAEVLTRWIAAQDLASPALWAYGDSAGDDAMLAMADHPVRVGARPLAAVGAAP